MKFKHRTRVVGSFPDGNSALMLMRAHTVRDCERVERADTSTCPGLAARRRKRTDHRAVDGHDPKYAIFRALPSDTTLNDMPFQFFSE
ncbi:hypothetical protein HMPREF3193_00208 [Bifidobacterium breve]|nr:hypothetical protein HMPREF1587_00033 [Bifidobacterium breve JCP7499]KWZ86722.1 hypothetical protein HMPREF3193_00208 [Bifidobacterium breve]